MTGDTSALRFGIDTFGDVTRGPDGAPTPQAQVIRDVVEEAVLADQVGLDAFGIGEHHRADFAVSRARPRARRDRRPAPSRIRSAPRSRCSAPTTRCACSSGSRRSTPSRAAAPRSSSAAARSPSRSRCSATTSPSTRRCSTRSSTSSPHLRTEQPVTWSGTVRAGLTDQEVFPHTESGALPTWIGVGGSPESVVRAARYGLPLMLAIIGGAPAPLRARTSSCTAARSTSSACRSLPVGVHSPGHVADDRRAGARASSGRTTRRCATASARERGWPSDEPRTSSSARPDATARSTSDRRRPSRRRSPRRSARSACSASTSSTAPARCRTT